MLWIDLENAPHIWIMWPIIQYFRKRGISLLLTARRFSYTVDLANYLGLQIQPVGPVGTRKSKIGKVWILFSRAVELWDIARSYKKQIKLAFSHGSRAQIIAAKLHRIPMLIMDDYEYSNQFFVRFVDKLLVPFPISKEVWGKYSRKVVHYPGLKEEIYLANFNFKSEEIPKEILGKKEKVVIIFRPESRLAHYYSYQSSILQRMIIKKFAANKDRIFVVVFPREKEQEQELVKYFNELGIDFWIPHGIINGPLIIAFSDLVIGGGGTMTREAAVLGVPSYSFFSGKWGGVDNYLEKVGKLVRIKSDSDLNKIKFEKRTGPPQEVSTEALEFVLKFVEEYLQCSQG
ncbi:hypothetical protein DRN58_02300 [Thermococci archaeon]|nr:MAG: hypothetical protein DRN58_02300 [Thermococci archaeon]